jgi:hypothetical protein
MVNTIRDFAAPSSVPISGWKRYQRELIGNEIKVMKRINNRPVAVEAVLTGSGTIVGPFMSELTGHQQLTPYRGGWCGNEMYPEVLTESCGARQVISSKGWLIDLVPRAIAASSKSTY